MIHSHAKQNGLLLSGTCKCSYNLFFLLGSDDQLFVKQFLKIKYGKWYTNPMVNDHNFLN